jgi:peptidyl-tRNA hydrolase, PTH1 family
MEDDAVLQEDLSGSGASCKIKLIVGLGNPGSRYRNTRHNVGFMAIDRLLKDSPAKKERNLRYAMLYETERFGTLCKTMTYMNESGAAVAEVSREYNLQPAEILVLYDDFALNLGLIRIRARGSSGGHNGLQSVIEKMGTEEVPRIRLGIQTPEMQDWVDFVLSDFRPQEKKIVEEMLDSCADAVEVILNDGIITAMNRFNRKQKLDKGDDSAPGPTSSG